MYKRKPEVRRYGQVELLEAGPAYYSRTREVYVNDRHLGSENISVHGFGIIVFDYREALSGGMRGEGKEECRPGYVCLLNGDHERCYRVHRRLADRSLVVADGRGNYYHVGDGKEKEYIGCDKPAEEGAKCMARIEQIARQAVEARRGMEAEKAEKRRRLLDGAEEAVPFRSGTKWGLKVGGRVTVPPVYRSVRPPVGRYCAVEKNYSQWGVIALDGTWMVEPQYAEIEIGAQGTVTGTKANGKKVSVKLP